MNTLTLTHTYRICHFHFFYLNRFVSSIHSYIHLVIHKMHRFHWYSMYSSFTWTRWKKAFILGRACSWLFHILCNKNRNRMWAKRRKIGLEWCTVTSRHSRLDSNLFFFSYSFVAPNGPSKHNKYIQFSVCWQCTMRQRRIYIYVWWRLHSNMLVHSILAETIFRSLQLNSLAYFLFNFSRFRFLDDRIIPRAFGRMLLEICTCLQKASLCHLLSTDRCWMM